MKALRQPRLIAALPLPNSSDGRHSIMEERSSTSDAMPASDPLRWEVPTIAAAVRAKRIDPVEVIDTFLAWIRRANSPVNALVNHDEAASRAMAADVCAAVNASRYSALEWASGRGDRCRNGGLAQRRACIQLAHRRIHRPFFTNWELPLCPTIARAESFERGRPGLVEDRRGGHGQSENNVNLSPLPANDTKWAATVDDMITRVMYGVAAVYALGRCISAIALDESHTAAGSQEFFGHRRPQARDVVGL